MKYKDDRIKKRLIVLGGLIVCIILLNLISLQFKKEPIMADILPVQTEETTSIIIEKPEEESVITKGEDDIIVTRIETTVIDMTEITEKETTTDVVTEQTIQTNVEKPKEPTEEQLTDPSQKPDGEKVETPPVPVEHNNVEKPAETEGSGNEPQAGDTNSKGQTYMPGFGWIENSGENQGNVAEDMYENGNKIGIMD